jgi:hypothetical protein
VEYVNNCISTSFSMDKNNLRALDSLLLFFQIAPDLNSASP